MLTNHVPTAATVEDLAAVFHTFDARRYAYLAQHLRDAGLSHIADLAERWSGEHQGTADRLNGQGEVAE